jgi:hypothetical protein
MARDRVATWPDVPSGGIDRWPPAPIHLLPFWSARPADEPRLLKWLKEGGTGWLGIGAAPGPEIHSAWY